MKRFDRSSVFRRTLTLSVLALTATGMLGAASPDSVPPSPGCSPVREYITFIEYLRSKSEWKLPEPARRELAGKVAIHCPGSAGRVIRVTSLLSESGVGSKDAVQTGVRFAAETDDLTERFIVLFKKLYLQDELDLDVATSHKMALALSADFGGTLPALQSEFETLVRFCAEETGLGQSKSRCAEFASHLLTAAKSQGTGVAKRFKSLFEFLISSDSGPKMSPGQALKLAEQIAGTSEVGPESFVEGYKYALSKKGLGQSSVEAVQFARDLVLEQMAAFRSKNATEAQAQETPKPPKS